MGTKLDLAVAILNGTVGDYLARTGNGLATPMTWATPRVPAPATARAVVLVHGLMCTEGIFRLPDGEDYGSLLARDLGYTPYYVRYNSGLSIPANGAALASLLDGLAAMHPGPLDEILIVAHSMGGLVVRSACHVAAETKLAWLPLVKRAIYVGTPHRGAPLERAGRLVARLLEIVDDPFTRLIADIGNRRSDGVKDLGDADLRHEDRARRAEGVSLGDRRHPVPLLPDILHHLIAGTISPEPWLATLFGDALVPIASATAHGDHVFPAERVKIFPGVHHNGLAHNAAVYALIRDCCAP